MTLSGSQWSPGGAETYIGAFELAALSEIGVWTKLLHSAGIPSHVLIFANDPGPKIQRSLQTSFPPSRLQDIILVDDSGEQWRNFIQPDRPERAFAMHVRDGMAEPLMVGPPTEEAWDLFQLLVNSER